MRAEILYEEIQQFDKIIFSQLWLKRLAIIFLICSLISFLICNEKTIALSIFFLSVSLITVLLNLFQSKTKLITQIRTDGIYVSFPPFQSSFTIYLWENIAQLTIRNYDPIREFGGWGIRRGQNNSAFNVSGNIGIQIIFIDGTKLLIGTNKPDEIASVLLSLGKLNFHFNE